MQTPWAANETQPIPRTPAENTAPTIGSGKHPTGSAQRDTAHRTPRSDARNTLPWRSHTRGPRANKATARPRPEKPAKRGKYGRRKGPDLRPGPGAHALGRLPWLAGFPARERRLRPRRLIVAPQIDCAPERHTTDRKCISRRRRPLCAAATASRPIRPAHPRGMKGLSNRIPFSFGRPALVVPRLLFSVCSPSPQKRPARSPAPAAGKNRGAPENAKRGDAFPPFTEEHFAWKTLYAQERPTREGCPQAELCTPVLV